MIYRRWLAYLTGWRKRGRPPRGRLGRNLSQDLWLLQLGDISILVYFVFCICFVFCIFYFVYTANIYACCSEGGRVYERSKQQKGWEITPSKLQNIKDHENLIHFSSDAQFIGKILPYCHRPGRALRACAVYGGIVFAPFVLCRHCAILHYIACPPLSQQDFKFIAQRSHLKAS